MYSFKFLNAIQLRILFLLSKFDLICQQTNCMISWKWLIWWQQTSENVERFVIFTVSKNELACDTRLMHTHRKKNMGILCVQRNVRIFYGYWVIKASIRREMKKKKTVWLQKSERAREWENWGKERRVKAIYRLWKRWKGEKVIGNVVDDNNDWKKISITHIQPELHLAFTHNISVEFSYYYRKRECRS